MDEAEKAFHEGSRAHRTLDKLVALRRDQQENNAVNYESLLAPFFFKMGDYLATYIMLNTDELGTVKPFEEDVSESEDGGEEPD